MLASDSPSLPLQERVSCPKHLERVLICIISGLIVSLLVCRIALLPGLTGLSFGVWLVALLCESWFSFIWILAVNEKWHFIENKTFPENLLYRFKESKDFPGIDVFVTTADPTKEPSIITINTVLSILAVDYPVEKIACYVSDDACSPITFYSLVQASKFAKLWVPFCKRYEVKVRAPFKYFSQDHQEAHNHGESLFHHEWMQMKRAYEELTKKIAEGTQKPFSDDEFSGDQFQDFADIDRRNHPAVLKVIHEHKETDQDELPHLIYVSREKRQSHPDRFKAGAMNVLTRVSGVMTNAPFILNLDCDMFVNNPKVMHHALCLLLGFESEKRSGFVQFPQMFHDGIKDDPYGNQFKILAKYLMHGIEAYQGPFYAGTGCFHRRKIIYGQPPPQHGNAKDGSHCKLVNGCQSGSCKEALRASFGPNESFTESAMTTILEGNAFEPPSKSRGLSSCLEAANHVSACDYERSTSWGKRVGWCYGTITEDILTGLRIHSAGWSSVACFLEPPAFLGCAPSSGPDTLLQQKRWATGLLEVLVHPLNPLGALLREKLQLRQGLVYLTFLLWATRSVPEFCYAVLPAFCIIMDISIFPKANDPAFRLPAAIFVTYNLYTLMEYLLSGLTVREWWNNQRMERIKSATSWLFGFLAVFMKICRISETVFELTNKDDDKTGSSANDEKAGKFVFDSSPIYIPATTMLMVNLIALVMELAKIITEEAGAAHVGELVCCVWVVLSFLPFLKGLFRKGRCGFPWPTILKSSAAACLFLCFSKRLLF